MFSLLHGLTTEARGKRCVCSMRSSNNLYVSTLVFELFVNFSILDFFCFLNIPISMGGITSFIILCVFCHFLISNIYIYIYIYIYVYIYVLIYRWYQIPMVIEVTASDIVP